MQPKRSRSSSLLDYFGAAPRSKQSKSDETDELCSSASGTSGSGQCSIELESVSRYPCRFFTISGSGRSDVAFTRNGSHDWKHALGKKGSLQKHDKCQSHIDAMVSWNAYTQMKSSNSSVADMLGSARAQHVEKNVHYMKTIAEVILLCSQQEIGLRGHNESEDSLNRGNFLEILKLVALHDKTVQDRLQQGPKNSMYTSPEIQNSLLHTMGDLVRKMICDSVQQAGYFTLMADESKDCSKCEQFSVVFRYADVDTGTIYERFLTYVHAASCTADSLTSYIKEVLDKYHIDPSKMVCQSKSTMVPLL